MLVFIPSNKPEIDPVIPAPGLNPELIEGILEFSILKPEGEFKLERLRSGKAKGSPVSVLNPTILLSLCYFATIRQSHNITTCCFV